MARIVEVLGPGCRRCTELDTLVRDVARAEFPDIETRYVTDPGAIVARGLFMRTPALVIDGRLVASGRVPSRKEVRAWLATPQEAVP